MTCRRNGMSRNNMEVLTMDKTIQFVFADTKLKAIDCFDDIWQAARFAQHNLYMRHGIDINRPIVAENNFVTMTMHIPNHLISSFFNRQTFARNFSIFTAKTPR